MTTSTPASTHTTGGPPTTATKPPGVSVSSLFMKVGPRLLLLLVMVLSVLLGFAQFTSPAVVPTSASATEFSAERAMTKLQVIAQQSRLIGSPANAQTRAYLMQQISAMGLKPEVQTATVTLHPPGWDTFQTGTVHNVVARLKGTASTSAILLDAHYDSGATGLGASDEGSGVVTLLETMRALTAGPPLKNDVIFVFADGEERDMLGAYGFATQHPWMQDVGLALNFEAGGSGGPAEMYMTSQQNGWLINEFLQAAPAPLASSFLNNLAWLFSGQRLGCDLEEYMARGSAGLDFLYIGNTPVYHTILDNVHTIDPSSIQHEGSYALALVRHFGAMDLSQVPTAPNDVVFNILPGMVVHYSETWAVPLAVGILLLLLGVLALGFRRKHLKVGGFALGTLISPASVIGVLILTILVWVAFKSVNPSYQVAMAGSYYGSDLVVLGLATLVIAAMSALFLWLGSKIRMYNMAAGALVWWAILMLLSSLFFPGGSYIFTWPLLASVLALGWMFFINEPAARTWLRAVVLSVASVPGIVLLTSAIILLLPLATRFDVQGGIPATPIPNVFVALLAGLLIPQFAFLSGEPHTDATENCYTSRGRRRLRTGLEHWLVPISAFLIGIVVLGAAIGISSFSAARPGTDQISYKLNADTGQATWQSDDQRLDVWTRQFFPASTGQGSFQAKAPSVALAAPTTRLISDTLSGGTRTLRVQVASPRHAPYASVLVAASLDGQPFDLSGFSQSTRQRLDFSYYGLPDKGFELQLKVASSAPIKITVQDLSNGLPSVPGMTIKPRPADLMPAPRDWLDPTMF
jgi:Peptidase family M28